jgi:hypothetical protein
MTLGLLQLDKLRIDSHVDTWLDLAVRPSTYSSTRGKVLSVASKCIDRKKREFFMQILNYFKISLTIILFCRFRHFPVNLPPL